MLSARTCHSEPRGRRGSRKVRREPPLCHSEPRRRRGIPRQETIFRRTCGGDPSRSSALGMTHSFERRRDLADTMRILHRAPTHDDTTLSHAPCSRTCHFEPRRRREISSARTTSPRRCDGDLSPCCRRLGMTVAPSCRLFAILNLIQLAVQAVDLHQLIVCAALANLPVVEHEDRVGGADG